MAVPWPASLRLHFLPCVPLQLLAGASSKNMPNLRNLAMELRKVCCHPVSF